MIIRKAKLSDVRNIQELVNYYAGKDEMLPRSLSMLYESIRDFSVAISDSGELIGCCAGGVCWEDMAEIKSLAVKEECKGQGIGRMLVEKSIEGLKELGVTKVFTLTYSVGFFEKLGFSVVEKKKLPQKIWTECVYCPKFPDCGEEAMLFQIP